MPQHSLDLEHLDVAAYYWAGAQGTEVGGDWYDVIPLPDGRTALVVGDVMGRGASAAAVMAQLRTVVRTYTRLELPPSELMTSLDNHVRLMFPEQVVTAIYAVFDPRDHSLDLVNAGHVPPLVLRGSGTCALLATEPHPPLGMGDPFGIAQRVSLQPGDAVLIYTDGLVEQRGQDLDQRIEALRRLVAEVDPALAELPAHLARTMLPHGPDDDVAILAARVRPDSVEPVRETADVEDLLGDRALGRDQLELGPAVGGGAHRDGEDPDSQAG